MTSPLTTLSELLDGAPVALVQPVVRADSLLVGEGRLATPHGETSLPSVGRPWSTAVGVHDRSVLLERYHLELGGVIGPPPEGATHKTPSGLRAMDALPLFAHLLPPSDAPVRACWLVLDGHALGLVLTRGRRPEGRHHEELGVLGTLRRQLARSLEALTSRLTATGVIVIEEGELRAADRRGAAWAAARDDTPLRPGVEGGALVGRREMDGQAALEVMTIRPVRAAVQPLGLYLTPAQREVARLLSSSATLEEVARARGTRSSTAARHRDDIYQLLGTSRRTELMRRLHEV